MWHVSQPEDRRDARQMHAGSKHDLSLRPATVREVFESELDLRQIQSEPKMSSMHSLLLTDTGAWSTGRGVDGKMVNVVGGM